MKTILLTLTTVFSIICVQAQDKLTDEQKEKLIQHVSTTIDKYCQKDYDGMLEGYTQDATLLDPAMGKVLPIAAWAEARKPIDQNYSTYSLTTEYEVVNQMGNSTWVFVYGQWDLKHKLSGKEASFPIHFAHRIKGEKIVETRAYFDRVAIMVPLGYTITPPAEDK